jgi:hypothetical protein
MLTENNWVSQICKKGGGHGQAGAVDGGNMTGVRAAADAF